MESALSHLESFRAALHRQARRMLADDLAGKVDLSGVVQEALVEAWRVPADKPARGAGLYRYLRRILASKLVDAVRRVRRRGRRPVRECSLEGALEGSSPQLGGVLAREHSSLDQGPERAEQRQRLAAALARLPEDQRRAVELHHLEGLPVAAVGEHLGRSRAAAAKLVLRGLHKLRELLEEPGRQGGRA